MLYNSYDNVKFTAFKDYQLPDRSKETSYWEGVPHQDLVKTVRKVAKEKKLKVVNEEFQLANKGHTLFASWDFARKVPGMQQLTMAMGYRGSNVGRYSHTFATGARVSMCENGCIFSEFQLRRKHTNKVDLLELVEAGFDQYLEDSKRIKDYVGTLIKRKLTDDEAAHLMLEACRRGILSWSKLRVVDKQWREPSHSAFEDYNAWSLYNAFTQAAKLTTPAQQIQIMREIPTLLLEEPAEEE